MKLEVGCTTTLGLSIARHTRRSDKRSGPRCARKWRGGYREDFGCRTKSWGHVTVASTSQSFKE